MRILVVLTVLIIAYMESVFAETQRYVLDESKKIDGYISKDEINRIKIEGDRISEVIGLSEDFLLESDEKLGQIFIRANEASESQKADFTVVTEKGKTQDLRLIVRSKAGGQAILIECAEEMDDKKIVGNKHIRHDEIVSLIKLAKNLPPNIKGQQSHVIKDNLKVTLLTRRKLGNYTVEIWDLQNIFSKKQSFIEKQFASNDTAAIMLDQMFLDAGERTNLYKVLCNG